MTISVWLAALAIYGLFRYWYDGVRKPLTEAEINGFMASLRANNDRNDSDYLQVMHNFMQQDDGKEFIMVNLLQYQPSPVMHPDSGEPINANTLLLEYFKPLMKVFIKRAGHPVISSRAVGGYIDAWGTPANPGWHGAGLIRYRSRRDAMQATITSNAFDGIHKYKHAALKQTFAFPSQTIQSLYASPRVTVALLLALGAALVQIALLV